MIQLQMNEDPRKILYFLDEIGRMANSELKHRLQEA